MDTWMYRALGASLLLLSLTSCFGSGQSGAVDSLPARIAKEAISVETQISLKDILVTDIEAIDYRDSSLGCPQTGMTYLQVITPGYRVKAQAGVRKFDVRIAGDRAVICTPERSLERQISGMLNDPKRCTAGPWSGTVCKE
jgi:hypothetical protein